MPDVSHNLGYLYKNLVSAYGCPV